MREILFRGKRIDNKEWVYGDLIHCKNNDYRILEQGNGDWDILEAGYKVDPATIGQFTGIYDKNGKRIFEGDIIEYKTVYEWDKKPIKRAEVVFENGMFGPAGVIMDLSRSKIIRNIHDEVKP